jgi:hypothetical protein
MNIRILAASILAMAAFVPVANAAPAQSSSVSHTDLDKCSGDLNLATTECKINPASSADTMPLAVQSSTAGIASGSNGSGSPASRAPAQRYTLITKANPVLDFSTNGN